MENTVDFTKLWEIIKKNWKLLVLLPIVFLLISLAYTFFIAHPKYEATTQVLVNQKEKEKDMMAQQVQSNIQLVNTYSEILKSPRIIDEVAKKEKKYSAKEISKMVTVTTQANSQILNVAVANKSKEDAERVANEVANVFHDEMPDIMNVDNVSILSKADGTSQKTSPKTSVNLLLGLVFGLLLAILLIILKEIFDKRIKTEEDVDRELNIPVLGSIQKLK